MKLNMGIGNISSIGYFCKLKFPRVIESSSKFLHFSDHYFVKVLVKNYLDLPVDRHSSKFLIESAVCKMEIKSFELSDR